jgi:NDP-sugar pyrophosphorylase family protein
MLPALVLTAGLGTRLDPLTRLIAKPAVPLAGLALIERILLRLASQGVTDAVLNLHHLPSSITGLVADGVRLGIHVRYSWEPVILGSAGGPRHALSLLDSDTLLIVNGDTLCDVDLGAMLQQHRDSGADVTMAVVRNPAPDRYNGVVLDDDKRVTGFAPKGRADGTWHFVGYQLAQAHVFEHLPDGEASETVSGLYKKRIAAGSRAFRGFSVEAPFVDVGTPLDYLHAALGFANGHGAGAIEPGADIDPGADVARSSVWPKATIGPGAKLDRCIVTNIRVPKGFESSNAILTPAAIVRAGDNATIAGNIAVYPL